MSKKHKRKKYFSGVMNRVVKEDKRGGYWWDKNPKGDAIFPSDFSVKMSAAVYNKLFSYVKSSNLEVSGLGLVRKVGNSFEVYDVFVLEQESSGGGTKLDGKAISDLMLKMIKEKKEVGDLRFWWHSHPHFGTFWSGTDDATCERLVKDSFLLAWGVNHDHSVRCRIDLMNPFRVTLDNIPITIEGREDRSIDEKYSREAKDKVKGIDYGYGKQELLGFRGRGVEEYEMEGGKTLFVNSHTLKSSYNKGDVEEKGVVRLFSRVDVPPGVYGCMRRAFNFIHYESAGYSLTLHDNVSGLVMEREDSTGMVVVKIWGSSLVRVPTSVLA